MAKARSKATTKKTPAKTPTAKSAPEAASASKKTKATTKVNPTKAAAITEPKATTKTTVKKGDAKKTVAKNVSAKETTKAAADPTVRPTSATRKKTNREPAPAKPKKGAKVAPRREIRCYLCGHCFEVSERTMSTTCAKCHKAIKVEDVAVKSYVPVSKLQTCGRIKVTKRGRVAAKTIQSGDGITCEGALEGIVETDGDITLGPKSSWKGSTLQSRTLVVEDGAQLHGYVTVPWRR